MTCYLSDFYKTKKEFTEAIKDGKKLLIIDPSIVKPRRFLTSEIKEGEYIAITNHPQRSWFASMTRKNGKLQVK